MGSGYLPAGGVCNLYDAVRPVVVDRAPLTVGGRNVLEQPRGTVTVDSAERAAQRADEGARSGDWRRALATRVRVTDLVVLLAAAYGSWWLRFGGVHEDAVQGASWASYLGLAAALSAAWWVSLGVVGSRDSEILGSDPVEYGRVLLGTFVLYGALGIVSLVFVVDLSRSFLVLACVLAVPLLLLDRLCWRLWLRGQRRRGRRQSLVLVLGTVRAARRIARSFYADPHSAYRVTGAYVPDSDEDDETLLWRTPEDRWPPIPLRGNTHTLREVLAECGADTVIVTDSEQLGPDGLNSLMWELEPLGVELLVSPNVVGVIQPRVHLRDVSNVPYVYVEKPRYAGANRSLKSVFDKAFAALSLVVLSPVLLALTIAVKVTSPGPVLERSRRIGAHGVPFTMYSFRTMRTDADTAAKPADVPGVPAGLEQPRLLLTAEDDERLTRLGAFLRRYSLSDLPQLLNVLRGDMSVVGPRPLRPEDALTPEDALGPDETIARRLLVKQGITGLWQVSGGARLSQQEAARLDLEYVENWSMLRDLSIVWRTLTMIVARTAVLRAVDRLQAEIDERAPSTQAQLRVDSRGTVWLNGFPLFSADTPALLDEIEAVLARRRPALLVTANVDQILDLEREQKTVEVYENADLIVIDGMPVVQLARMLGAADVHRHTGADLLPLMAAESAARGWRVSILGGAPGVSERAAAELRGRHPGAEVASVDFPLLRGLDDPASLSVIDELKVQQPDVVFVCLGAPKQELWFLQWRDLLPPAVYVGAGAAVDFAAQKVRRAPVVVQRLGAEWLWRLAQEPRRLFGRYLVKGPRFIGVILRSVRTRRRQDQG